MNILNLIHITTHRANEERKAVEASLRATIASLEKQIDNQQDIIHDLREQLVDAQRQANTLVADKVRLTKELKRAQTSLALRNQQFSSAAQEGRRAGKRHINSTKGKKK